jgi:hypothetical protein
MKYLLTLVLLFTTSAFADSWDNTDKALFVTSESLLFADWLQTRKIAESPDQYSEKNAILGASPSLSKTNLYFSASMLGNYFIADYLDGYWRKAFLTGVIGLEVYVVNHNTNIGIKVAF